MIIQIMIAIIILLIILLYFLGHNILFYMSYKLDIRNKESETLYIYIYIII